MNDREARDLAQKNADKAAEEIDAILDKYECELQGDVYEIGCHVFTDENRVVYASAEWERP